ncbi:adenylate kinase [Cupriavidus sp. IDO]|uniref:adenylate kinase n=1 Tax=Cupriavidus sp. IDO TaxID=1539142 RepID=UPI001EE71379|nr:adenylate kinase [Cupriavidus sp. IDO]
MIRSIGSRADTVSRDRATAIALAKAEAARDCWVVEGIYGWLVREIQDRATTLIWICLDEAECSANIRQRGTRGGASAESFNALLDWADSYRSRDGSSSFSAHRLIFDEFAGAKEVLPTRRAVKAFADNLALRRS